MTNTTNNMTAVRVTKAMKLNAIIGMVQGTFDEKTFSADNHVPVTFGRTEAIDFLTAEIELLSRKNSGDRKQTATQKENDGYKNTIIEFLNRAEEDFEPSESTNTFIGMTCTEILKNIPAFADFSNQKIAALCNQLEKAGKLSKSEVKGKKYFKVGE